MKEFDLIVIGAGPAGLSAAIEASRQGASALLLEAEDTPGGLTRSFSADGYTFDCSGHLLHLSHPEAVELVEEATTPSSWNRIDRSSTIYSGGALVPYPFQLHLAHAPEEVRRDCLENLPSGAEAVVAGPADNFGSWIRDSLGAGIGRHFMVPYNEKLSTVSVDELTCEWLGRFVPQPSLEEIRRGAESKRTVDTGYNRSFLYPASGGIGSMSRALAARVPNLVSGARVSEIDTRARIVSTDDGRSFGYGSAVIATVPLPALSSMVSPAGPAFGAAAKLRANQVTCVNLGIAAVNPRFAQYQWIYLPEPRFRAYRVGFYSRFAEGMAPAGKESVYVEIAHSPDADEESLVDAAVKDLLELGAIEGEGEVETVFPVRIECAYVIHDRQTSAARETLHRELRERDVWVAGRYACWEYSAMEDALVQGIEAARGALRSAERAGVRV